MVLRGRSLMPVLLGLLVVLLGVGGYVWYNKLKEEGVLDQTPPDRDEIEKAAAEVGPISILSKSMGSLGPANGGETGYDTNLIVNNGSAFELNGVLVEAHVYSPSSREPIWTGQVWFGGFQDTVTEFHPTLLPGRIAYARAVINVPPEAAQALASGNEVDLSITRVKYYDRPKDMSKPGHVLKFITAGDFDGYRQAVEADPALLNAKGDHPNVTASHIAAGSNNTEVLAFLASKGANLDARTTSNLTPLMCAAKGNAVSATTFLVGKRINLDTQGYRAYTALSYSIGNGSLANVRALVEGGANIEVEDADGNAALASAAALGSEEIVRYLLTKKPKLEQTDATGRTSTLVSAGSGSLETVKMLVKAGGKTKVVDKDGYTMLHYAASKGVREVVQYVLTLGLDKRAKDNMGRTPYDIALAAGNPEVANLVRP